MNAARATALAAPAEQRWRGFALRGLKTAIAGVGVAICLWTLTLTRGGFMTTLVYSICISLMCWLFIDGARSLAVHRWPVAEPGHDAPRGRWPGWRWTGGHRGRIAARWSQPVHCTGCCLAQLVFQCCD